MAALDMNSLQLPYLEPEIPVMMNHFKIGKHEDVLSSSLICTRKLEFTRVFLHQIFETLDGDNLAESHVSRFRPGLRPQDFHRLVD
jgi:hypothetical protein